MIARKLLLSTVALAGLALAVAGPTSLSPSFTTPASAETGPSATVSIDLFEDRLGGYGDWVEYEDGTVWVPSKVDADWQPYTRGRWVFVKAYGWTWVSNDEWGWATDHYGRWGFKEDIGWYWVPGTVWAPAWVSWRRSKDHVAWAPLPPKGHKVYVRGVVDVEPDEEIPVVYWRVVPIRAFVAEEVSTVVVIGEEAGPLIREAKPVGTVRVRNNILVNDVIEPEFVEREAGVKVVVHEARTARSFEEAGRVNERRSRSSMQRWIARTPMFGSRSR